MKNFGALLILCMVSCAVYAKPTIVREIKNAIRECDIIAVKSGFRKLDDEVESTEKIKEHLESLIEVAQEVVKDPPMVDPEGSSVVKLTKKVGGGLMFVLGVVGIAVFSKIYMDSKEIVRINENADYHTHYPEYRACQNAKDRVIISIFGGIGSGIQTGIGGMLLLSCRKKSGLPQAEAIEAYLQNELSYLNEDHDEDY